MSLLINKNMIKRKQTNKNKQYLIIRLYMTKKMLNSNLLIHIIYKEKIIKSLYY